MHERRRSVLVPVALLSCAAAWGCGGKSAAPEAQAVAEPPAPAADKPCDDPSPGPIIILTPTDDGSGKLMTKWTFASDDSEVPQGTDDKISIRFIGRIFEEGGLPVGFRLQRKSSTTVEYPDDVTLVIKSGQSRTVRLRRENMGGVNYFDWRFGTPPPTPLGVCDDVEENCVPDCTDRKNTLPAKMFGEIVSITTNLSPAVDLADLKWIKVQADVQHPCP